MYRQISVHEDHRRFQRILWRFLEDQPLRIFNLNTVTYGLAPSVYQALRCLCQLTLDKGEKFPLVCNYPEENMHVDDAFFGQAVPRIPRGRIPITQVGCSHSIKWLAEKPIEDSLAYPNHPLLGLISKPLTYDFLLC